MFFTSKKKRGKGAKQCMLHHSLNSIQSEMQTRFKKLSHRDDFLHSEIIGKDATFLGPFGERQCIYFDSTASGKPLRIVEDFVAGKVLPFYANTHTTISFTSFVMSTYRNEAREILRDVTGASEDDVVLFCGSGTTAAIHKLIHVLGISLENLPIVFVGPFEHHSNLLPWRETGAKVINIPVDNFGAMDLEYLESQLVTTKLDEKNNGRSIYGCFSAGSNVTGLLTDDVKVTRLLHKYGGLCFWDYASAAPHVTIRMNPGSIYDDSANKDALYFSGHKFPGGPQTPGILVVKRHVFRNTVPHNAGGGTVFFVTPERHAYLRDEEEAQEGGTQGIVESIRLGALLSLRNLIGIDAIIKREVSYTRKVLSAWQSVSGLIILGNTTAIRLPIISFLIEHPQSGYYLHQNFVVALLNDIFGIQCRGGCMCAGPYAQILLNIDVETAEKYESALSCDCSALEKDLNQNDISGEPVFHMIYRPGFTRVSIPAETTLQEVDFLIASVKLVATHGWKLLPHYSACPRTGIFRLQSPVISDAFLKKIPQNFQDVLSTAAKIFQYTEMVQTPLVEPTKLQLKLDHLRWFMLPHDAEKYLQPNTKAALPSSPRPFSIRSHCQPNESKLFSDFQRYSKSSIPFEIQIASMPEDTMKSCKKFHLYNDYSGINNQCKLLRFSQNNIYADYSRNK